MENRCIQVGCKEVILPSKVMCKEHEDEDYYFDDMCKHFKKSKEIESVK
jgi:hypothetical protein